MSEGMRNYLIGWEDFRGTGDEYRELDAERVLVLTHFSARGKRSGLEVGQIWTKAAHVFHIHDGKVTRLVVYWDRARALADLGLASEGDGP
jgi:ketosteroid isomerase-like protein